MDVLGVFWQRFAYSFTGRLSSDIAPMISYLKGHVAQVQQLSNTKTILVLEVQGIGYEIQVPGSSQFPLQSAVQIFTHQQVREDQVLLYGFGTAAERDLFRQLILVSGVGASIGIALIDSLGLTELVQAIVLGNTKILAKTPGVGTKTAERLTVELKTKLRQWREAVDLQAIDLAGDLDTKLQVEVETTLLALGYSDLEIRQALQAVSANEAIASSKNVEDWLRYAIAVLAV
jgi:Holliday junction DNA helicase RuvA